MSAAAPPSGTPRPPHGARAPVWLVTGATGFLGRHLLERLHAERPDARLLALVRDRAAWERLSWTAPLERVELVEGSVAEAEGPGDGDGLRDPRLAEVSGVFHLAALVRHSRRDPEPLQRTNVEGTRRVAARAALAGARLVYVSTSGTVGCFTSPEPRADETASYAWRAVARWPYYVSKIEAERAAKEEIERHSRGRLVVLRPPVLLGPGDHRFRTTSNILRFLEGRLPFVIRGGHHFVDVRDAAAALQAAMEHPDPEPTYHLPGHAESVGTFFERVAELAGRPPPRVLPAAPVRVLARALHAAGLDWLPDPVVVEMGSRHWGLATRAAHRDLGFAPRDPGTTVADTVEWLRKHHPALRER